MEKADGNPAGQGKHEKSYSRQKKQPKLQAHYFPSAIPNGRFPALLQEKVPVIANVDSGADLSVKSRVHVDALQETGSFLRTKRIYPPLRIALAVPDNLKRNDSGIIPMRSNIGKSATNLRPFRLRNINCVVSDHPMSDILLSGNMLQVIGFDLNEHLDNNHHTFHDTRPRKYRRSPLSLCGK